MLRCAGVFREPSHSPGRIDDDRAILERTGDVLAAETGCKVVFFTPEDMLHDVFTEFAPDVIFYMCEEPRYLDVISAYEQRGCITVNPVKGVFNTFRDNLVDLFEDKEFFPSSIMIDVDEYAGDADFDGCMWVKRGDYHAVEPEDVRCARDRHELHDILARFRERGISRVMLQRHVSGDLVKFYGVSTRWFHWFYHKGQEVSYYRFSVESLRNTCSDAASSAGLEVYGGDAIITEDGFVYVIDLNAWPSFALVRDVAAGHIARHIVERMS